MHDDPHLGVVVADLPQQRHAVGVGETDVENAYVVAALAQVAQRGCGRPGGVGRAFLSQCLADYREHSFEHDLMVVNE